MRGGSSEPAPAAANRAGHGRAGGGKEGAAPSLCTCRLKAPGGPALAAPAAAPVTRAGGARRGAPGLDQRPARQPAGRWGRRRSARRPPAPPPAAGSSPSLGPAGAGPRLPARQEVGPAPALPPASSLSPSLPLSLPRVEPFREGAGSPIAPRQRCTGIGRRRAGLGPTSPRGCGRSAAERSSGRGGGCGVPGLPRRGAAGSGGRRGGGRTSGRSAR